MRIFSFLDQANLYRSLCMRYIGGRHSQVIGLRLSTVFATDDVIYLMRRIRIVFVKEAVFATITGALCNQTPK